jgi:hypothetical protein
VSGSGAGAPSFLPTVLPGALSPTIDFSSLAAFSFSQESRYRTGRGRAFRRAQSTDQSAFHCQRYRFDPESKVDGRDEERLQETVRKCPPPSVVVGGRDAMSQIMC